MTEPVAQEPTGLMQVLPLFLAGLFLMILGMFPLACMCFAVIAARHWLAGERPRAFGVAAVVGAIALILLGSVVASAVFGAVTLLGCLAGALVERRWSYGWQLSVLAPAAFVFAAGFVISVRHEVTIMLNARIDEWKGQPGFDENMLDMFRWYDLNFAYLGMGMTFASVLFASAMVLSVLERGYTTRRKTTGFQRMRLPDWLVWVAIAVALLWLVDSRWHHEALRMVSWNAAVALSAVYWLNGFSILLYALAVFNATFLTSVLVITGMFLFGIMHVLGLAGLFDTWFDFRVRIRRLATRWQSRLGQDDENI